MSTIASHLRFQERPSGHYYGYVRLVTGQPFITWRFGRWGLAFGIRSLRDWELKLEASRRGFAVNLMWLHFRAGA